ncbi:MAG: NPCBM/NEW2 domain-containing protein [Roseibacillus sp.]|jgi:hypothetical protein
MNITFRIQFVVLLIGTTILDGTLNAEETKEPAESALRVAVELVDGSRFLGTTTVTSLHVKTKFSHKAISVPLSRVLAVSKSEKETVIKLGNGDQLAGSLDLDSLPVSTLTGKLAVPLEHVQRIDILRDSLDLTTVNPAKIVTEDPAYCSSNQIVHEGIEEPISDGKEATRYLYAHAPTTVTYRLDPQFRRFRAKGYLGSNAGKMRFVVIVDGKTCFAGPEQNKRSHVDIAVELPKGAKTLQLVVDDLGFKNNDHAFWLNPRLEK